ncbi:cecropin-1-like [Anastrepha ludens]|uniref:cecropin-1-like n=1 Tax=Anastrepha ludens TaxID=28586 RepID=UPI0023B0D5C3|nr:cecropin-1-like [Anastrepha ludens]
MNFKKVFIFLAVMIGIFAGQTAGSLMPVPRKIKRLRPFKRNTGTILSGLAIREQAAIVAARG